MVSIRADVITRRSYNRPLNDEGTVFETWEQTIDRVIKHQKWLWERALTHKLNPEMPLNSVKEDQEDWVWLNDTQLNELEELRKLLLERKVAVSGRTFWLGGTEIGKRREASNFNCAALDIQTIWDVVDTFWLLLQGSGVGFRPVPGTLTGFKKVIKNVTLVRSKNLDTRGVEHNVETFDPVTKVWTIKVGDSAEAWAKSIGKLLAGKYRADTLVLDFSEIRKPGIRLKNYGWLSQGDVGISSAYQKIVAILNKQADSLLSAIDILDIINLLGTVLSTRRSAEIAIYNYGEPEWENFAKAKVGIWENGKSHRAQSNNSLLFMQKPSKDELTKLFAMVNKGGNGEPGIINGKAMKERSPWASLTNPCGEILLPPSGGFCCLTTIDLGKFKDDTLGLHRAAKIIARANYRQTVVDFRDGILQEKWHLNNDFLHLCGVSIAGVVKATEMKPYDYARLERSITAAAYSMAKELDTAYPKQVTTNKPDGTIGKIYDSTEGMHKPLGRYIFNNVAFSVHDPLVPVLSAAGYNVFNHPYDNTAVLVTFPVAYTDVEFDEVDGKFVNLESAISQLERYKMLMQFYCHQNVSCTISYSIEETPQIVDWLYTNWDNYVAVSFLFRNDPTKTAADLGYPYLPQEVVTREVYDEYVRKLKPFDIDQSNSHEELLDDGCAGGVCPIR